MLVVSNTTKLLFVKQSVSLLFVRLNNESQAWQVQPTTQKIYATAALTMIRLTH